MSARAKVRIEYCVGCRWLLRASWMAQELLSTFEGDLAEVALIPSTEGGTYRVRLADEVIFDRAEAGGFPDLKALKQSVRDRIAPGRDLGHLDR